METSLGAKPLSIGEILDASAVLFAKNFKKMLIIAAVLGIPANLAISFIPYTLISRIVNSVFSILMAIAVVSIIHGTITNAPVSAWQAIGKSFRLWGRTFLTLLIQNVVVGFLSLLLVIPGIIWGVYYAFVLPIIVMRGTYYSEALDYSKSLVKGQWWRVLGYSLAVSLLVGIFMIGLLLLYLLFARPIVNIFMLLAISIPIDFLMNLLLFFSITVICVFFVNTDLTYPKIPDRKPAGIPQAESQALPEDRVSTE